MTIAFLVALAAGAAIGLVGGLFAVGGALIAIPVLTLAAHESQHVAQGTAMMMAIASATVTLVIYIRRGWMRWNDGWVLAGACTLAAWLSAHVVNYVPDRPLAVGFGVFLIVLGIYQFVRKPVTASGSGRVSLRLQAALGLVAGALSGFFVIGGALVVVPLLRRFADIEQREAQGLALMALLPGSCVGISQYALAGNVNWTVAVPLAIGATALAPLGAQGAGLLSPVQLGRAFAVLQILAGAFLIV